MTIKALNYYVPDSQIADLRARLSMTRWPDQAPDAPWAYGTDVSYLRELTDYWMNDFDWRSQEAKLNEFPQFMVPVAGINLHTLHVPGKGPNPKLLAPIES